MNSQIIIHRPSTRPTAIGVTLTSILLRVSSGDGRATGYRWSMAVDDGLPSADRLTGWRIAPTRFYATVWQAIRAANRAGWSISI